MMTNHNPTLGVTLTFTGEENEGTPTIAFTGSRPSKMEAVALGWLYMEATEQEQDRMLAEYGGVLIKRSLRAFANYAARTGQREVRDFALLLREEITPTPHKGQADDAEDVA